MTSAAKIAVTPWLDALRAAVEQVPRRSAPEAVHQLRVAIARIRVWLTFTGERRLGRELRGLRTKAAAVRDIDVQFAYLPPAPMARVLRWQRKAARRALVDALAQPTLATLLRRLAALPSVDRSYASEGLVGMARKALRRARAARRHPNDMERLHDWRRAVRGVRFALDWLGEDSEPLAALQHALGEVLDRAHMLATLRSNDTRDEALHAWRHRLKQELREAERGANHRWRAARRRLNDLA